MIETTSSKMKRAKSNSGAFPNHVQIVYDNYDIIHNPKVRELYPSLYDEVLTHDKASSSSWYSLSDEAYREFEAYRNNNEIDYVY